VVGGTSGTARQLAARGTHTRIAGRNAERLGALAVSDPGLIGHRADGGEFDSVAAVAASIGTIGALILTLGGGEGAGPIAGLDLDTLRRAFDAKFWAHLTTLRACLPHLAESASVTLVSAISARTGLAGTAGLAAINGAIESLVQPLAVELAPRRVNAVSPGWSTLRGGTGCPPTRGRRTSTRPRRRCRCGTSPRPRNSPRWWCSRPPTATSPARCSKRTGARG